MRLCKTLILCLVLTIGLQYELKQPTIFVTMLVRNKAHILPYFLSNFENLNYPKERISLWIRSDHNKDQSVQILKLWVTSVKDLYHSIFTEFVEFAGSEYPGAMGPGDWTKERFNHIIDLREASLNEARKAWADYYLAIDADVILTNTDILNVLIAKGKTVVAPMLKSEGFYSNFWCGMTDEYYYQRTEEYKPILDRDNVGCFEVPMVHTCVLVNLRKYESDLLTYVPSKVSIKDPKIPTDDIIAFALGAKSNNISLNVCNDEIYGFVTPPLDKEDELQIDLEQLRNIKVEILNNELFPFVNNLFRPYLTHHSKKDTLGFDKIFMINLLRRPERRERMLACFEELDLDVTVVDAVDGQTLNETFLEGIKFMPGFIDPYHKRPMKLGEIGCFLSHFYIWEEMVEKGYQSALVLEDDIRFEPYFRKKVEQLMEEVRRIQNWDLVYLGRKRLQHVDEPFVEGSEILVKVGYSYWTLGYALSNRGAKKLLDGDPLSKLVPVDEYLPILFDKHPEESYKSHFPQRDLAAFSAVPHLVYPIRYTGEEGYVSDTEDSIIIPENLQPALKEDL